MIYLANINNLFIVSIFWKRKLIPDNIKNWWKKYIAFWIFLLIMSNYEIKIFIRLIYLQNSKFKKLKSIKTSSDIIFIAHQKIIHKIPLIYKGNIMDLLLVKQMKLTNFIHKKS